MTVDNDGILEEEESFLLELNTSDPRAFVFSQSAIINILDNDSMFLCSLFSTADAYQFCHILKFTVISMMCVLYFGSSVVSCLCFCHSHITATRTASLPCE